MLTKSCYSATPPCPPNCPQLNAQDDAGVMEGNWSQSYDFGTNPTKWEGSTKILEEYASTGNPVRYAQCWVFAGVFTTCKCHPQKPDSCLCMACILKPCRDRSLCIYTCIYMYILYTYIYYFMYMCTRHSQKTYGSYCTFSVQFYYLYFVFEALINTKIIQRA